ncbi:MAG: hypothetical protein WA820_18725 [Bradyrhizobium sp.]
MSEIQLWSSETPSSVPREVGRRVLAAGSGDTRLSRGGTLLVNGGRERRGSFAMAGWEAVINLTLDVASLLR